MFIKILINKISNKFLFLISLLLILTQFSLTYFSIQNYPGDKLIYFFFSFSILIYLTFALLKSNSFFHIFLSIFIFLGFFWKLSLNLIIYNVNSGLFKNISRSSNCLKNSCDYVSNQLLNSNFYDNVLIVSLVGIFGFFFSSIFFKFIRKKINICSNIIPNFLYKNFISFFVIFGLIFITLISWINFEYLIFQKGLVSQSKTFFLNNAFGWLLLYGIPTLLTFYLNAEKTRNYKIFFLALNLSHLVHFIINISLLSRGMIFNTLSNILGYIKNNQNVKFIKILVSTLFLLILFFSSIHFVSLKRDKVYTGSNDNLNIINKENLDRSNKTIINLLINRWVGIEEMMLVENFEDKNFNFFLKSLNEKQSNQSIPLFDSMIFKNYQNIDRTKFNFVSIPGLIAFLYFSNSFLFVFLGCFLFSFFLSLIEIFALKISINNVFFASLIGQLLAYRIVHFGVYPLETYKFLISIFLCFIMHFVMNKMFLK